MKFLYKIWAIGVSVALVSGIAWFIVQVTIEIISLIKK